MLSLTRTVNESIMLYTTDGPIEVVVTKIKGQQARIGFAAPKSVKIVRSEIDETKNNNVRKVYEPSPERGKCL